MRLKIFTGRNTCFQCQRPFADSNLYCPNCGAKRRENSGQLFLRRFRRAAFSLILGAVVGVICVVILGLAFPDWYISTMIKFPLLSGRMEWIGVILGGLSGSFFYTMREASREP